MRDDRIYRETRWLSILVIPFLVAAVYILYLRPADTGELFAWPINPSMNARMLASAYIGGMFFFGSAILTRQWHHIKIGFLPIVAFTTAMGLATLLHWDRFTHNHISFIAWLALYMTTPFLVLVLWWRNRKTDPGVPDANDYLFSKPIRYMLGAVGGITLVIAVLLFLQPEAMIGVWPWTITPLTARVLSGLFALPAGVGLGIAFDPRWSSARIMLQSQTISIFFIVLAIVISWADFDQTRPATWIFVGGMVALLIGLSALYVFITMRQKKAGANA